MVCEVGGAGMAAMQVMGVSETVMLARIWGREEGVRLRRETCPPRLSLQPTHRHPYGEGGGVEPRQLVEGEEPTASPSAAHVSYRGKGERSKRS